jgi:hypothetical protein
MMRIGRLKTDQTGFEQKGTKGTKIGFSGFILIVCLSRRFLGFLLLESPDLPIRPSSDRFASSAVDY